MARGRTVLRALATRCDFIEVGVPCDDPFLDGPAIAEASAMALRHGFRMTDFFTVVDELSAFIPVVAMSYWKPINQYGPKRFIANFAAAGGQAIMVPDLPAAKSRFWRRTIAESKVGSIPFVRKHCDNDQLVETCADAGGFIYVAATAGLTGGQNPLDSGLPNLVARLRLYTTLPVYAGIGISTVAKASQAASWTDGVVVGSAFVRPILANPGLSGVAAVAHLATDFADAVHQCHKAIEIQES